MKVIAAIPARYQSTRLPGKLMADLGGMTVIERTVENIQAMNLFDDVIVVTDSQEIESQLQGQCKIYRSAQNHICGTDRIAEFAHDFDADLIVNVQGDEPFLQKTDIEAIIELMSKPENQSIDVVSLKHPIEHSMERSNPNYVKVVTDLKGQALYFSRSDIPFRRHNGSVNTYRHIGIYAFRKSALIAFAQQSPTPLEEVEVIEALRVLEMGMTFQLLLAQHVTIGIDTKEDLIWANNFLSE
ncbi:3-deoxy-manno-octulosonate cytidylyltransferase [Membranihabitans marinus]|uniref:3-deoxy-manno-octulosonate cytidylyltransferase n=1 Tax=Membranihabitans marinus TaxID=1227546 RepID=UPI001F01966B|nr:3-deoxy-manno-octulosonate cytidylyltransferase [Membranihabitans marinus]